MAIATTIGSIEAAPKRSPGRWAKEKYRSLVQDKRVRWAVDVGIPIAVALAITALTLEDFDPDLFTGEHLDTLHDTDGITVDTVVPHSHSPTDGITVDTITPHVHDGLVHDGSDADGKANPNA
jgi:hypothetical protein